MGNDSSCSAQSFSQDRAEPHHHRWPLGYLLLATCCPPFPPQRFPQVGRAGIICYEYEVMSLPHPPPQLLPHPPLINVFMPMSGHHFSGQCFPNKNFLPVQCSLSLHLMISQDTPCYFCKLTASRSPRVIAENCFFMTVLYCGWQFHGMYMRL